MRNTMQRTLVLDTVRQLDHPTAEQVYKTARIIHPALSIGTVYRNLGQLVEENHLRRVDLRDGARHFDITTAPHYHICCTRCGCLQDVQIAELAVLARQAATETGFTAERHELTLYGLCPDCQEIE